MTDNSKVSSLYLYLFAQAKLSNRRQIAVQTLELSAYGTYQGNRADLYLSSTRWILERFDGDQKLAVEGDLMYNQRCRCSTTFRECNIESTFQSRTNPGLENSVCTPHTGPSPGPGGPVRNARVMDMSLGYERIGALNPKSKICAHLEDDGELLCQGAAMYVGLVQALVARHGGWTPYEGGMASTSRTHV